MKKKIIISIVILFSLIMTGCGNNELTNNDNTSTNKPKVLETKVEDLNISLDMSGSFKKINYKYPSKCTTGNFGTYSIMDYMNGSEFIFRIAFYYFENKSLSETMETNVVKSKGTKNINGKEWHLYEGKSEDGKNILNYAYQYNSDTYTITFIHDKDITNFVDVFMDTVEFN